MIYTYPDYYKKFVCTGGDCKDNCCAAGWQIAVDEESLRMYEKMKGDIGVRIRNSIDWENGLFEQFEGKCTFLNEKGLCDIFCDAGEDKMCLLCRRYPRHYEEYENLREVSLSISCPAAAEILLENRGRPAFYSEEDGTKEEYEDFDYLMFTKLQQIRELLFDILWKREIPFAYRMALLLSITHEIQNKINADAIFELDMVTEKWSRLLKTDKNSKLNYDINKLIKFILNKYKNYRRSAAERRLLMQDMMSRLHKLEVLKSSWTRFVEDCEKLLYHDLSNEEYEALVTGFNGYYSEKEEEYAQLMGYFIYTYFCGSVYDYEPESKIRFALAAVLLIHEFDMALWYRGGRLNIEEQVGLVHCYSKEIEHSDLNLAAMERMMMKDGAFGLRKLVTVLVNL